MKKWGNMFIANLSKTKRSKIKALDTILILMLVILIGVLISSIFSTIEVFKVSKKESSDSMPRKISRMSLTGFDKELAIEFMDKNHDGRCDVCGMPVEQCIDSGQLECNMDHNAKIGILGSQHIHADWKIYFNGDEFDWLPYADLHERQMMGDKSILGTSAFIHIHPAQPPEKAGDVLHMHATGIPLWIFFKSVGMDFDRNCLTFSNQEKFCNDSNKKLKFFVNGKESNEFENYVFNDLDKILISYGDESEEEIKNQLASITDFAKLH